MSVCSASAVVYIAEWFAYSEQNTISTIRCSGGIHTEELFLWMNNNIELVIFFLFVLLVCCAVIGFIVPEYDKQPTD